MPHPLYILLRWLESSLCYLVQFATGILFIVLYLTSIDTTILVIRTGPSAFGDLLDLTDTLAAGVIGVLFLTYSLFDRVLDTLRHGPARLGLDIVMMEVMVRGAFFAFHLIFAPASPLAGHLSHPFFGGTAMAWLVMFFAAFLFPGLSYRRLEPLPSLRRAWLHHVAVKGRSYVRLAVLCSLLVGPIALVLPSLQFLP